MDSVTKMTEKRLAFLRHAKSSWDDSDLADFDRPLNTRGQRAASRMGAVLRAEKLQLDLVLCSAALRTRQTLERLDLPTEVTVRVEAELYGASASALLARLRRVDDDIRSVLMIGHNPGMHDAVTDILADTDSRPAKYPTAALAVMRLPVDRWRDVRPGIAHLESFTIPRSLS